MVRIIGGLGTNDGDNNGLGWGTNSGSGCMNHVGMYGHLIP